MEPTQPATSPPTVRDSAHASYHAGRQHGLAIAAIACGAIAFISMLGIEKAILALVLAILALRGPALPGAHRRLAQGAIALAIVYVLSFVAVLVLFHAKLSQLLHLLQQLG